MDIKIEGPVEQIPYFEKLLSQVDHKFDELKGKSLWELSHFEIKSFMNESVWIDDFLLVKKWPNEIQVAIVISPVAFFINQKKKWIPFYSNRKKGEGMIFNFEKSVVPVIEVDSKISLSEEFLDQTFELVEEINKISIFNLNNIESIFFDNKKGYQIKLIKPSAEVILGNSDFRSRVARVTQVTEYIEKHQIEARVIDSTFVKKVLVRLRKRL